MKPRGRPPLDTSSSAPSADVHLTLRAADYDRVDRLAREQRKSIQDVIRHSINRLIRDERGG